MYYTDYHGVLYAFSTLRCFYFKKVYLKLIVQTAYDMYKIKT